MADTNSTDLRDNRASPEQTHRSPSWLDGLPHNFDGWGPKTPDDEAADVVIHTVPDLKWSGDADHRHYVWTFQRARHH